MKLQTTCASDKAAHINVRVREKVSRETSISAQREESRELHGEKVRQKCRQERMERAKFITRKIMHAEKCEWLGRGGGQRMDK